jgi:hypothetical protein
MGEKACRFRLASDVQCGLHICINMAVPWTYCERAMNENNKQCPADPELFLMPIDRCESDPGVDATTTNSTEHRKSRLVSDGSTSAPMRGESRRVGRNGCTNVMPSELAQSIAGSVVER